ncbi:MAG: DUF1080 domain-containing protein [Puniceicoccaceae bacterium]
MKHRNSIFTRTLTALFLLVAFAGLLCAQKDFKDGFVDIFNGKDLSGWIEPDVEHTWKVIDGGILDYSSEGGNLTTEKEYEDYILQFEWRFKKTVGDHYNAKVFNHDGTQKVDADGKPMTVPIKNADSGVYLRGTGASQVNLWCWPCGSGQMWNYHRSADPELVRGALPMVHADNPVGEWNSMQITVRGESVHVVLNGKVVIENRMPGQPLKGPIVLQHHGGFNEKTKKWSPASSFIQFRNLRIKELQKMECCSSCEDWKPLITENLDGMLFKLKANNKDEVGTVTENKGIFTVKDGMLLISGKVAGTMYTKKVYKDYILEAELAFERPEGLTNWQDFRGNSGILAHMVFDKPGIKHWPRSIEVQGYNRQMARILPIPRDMDCPYESDLELIHSVRNPIGEWNKYRVEATGNKLTVHLNGVLISTVTGGESTKGHIGFQSEGAPTRWRNIRIKEK